MFSQSWVLIDTETTGFKAPIYVVDIAAQKMSGWKPVGPAFRYMINHGVDIPPEASRVNGYTREILERDGENPFDVYQSFSDYLGSDDLPICSYNLDYDLHQVLIPEWERLGIAAKGESGFCAMRLAQRLLDPVPAGNCKLQTLRQYYRLPERGAHTALGDVETVVDLMDKVLAPLAESRGLNTLESITRFVNADWYPSRINFGKFKGVDFRDARTDKALLNWLNWLTESNNAR
jgi:DNA polymerase-3 subunit epsilon